jgi:hypothetical protein
MSFLVWQLGFDRGWNMAGGEWRGCHGESCGIKKTGRLDVEKCCRLSVLR